MTNPKAQRSAAPAATTLHQDPIWSQVEQLSLKLGALEVLLFNATGDACESFNAMDEQQREVYLSHCAELATAAKVEAKRITSAAVSLARGATTTA